MLVWLFLKGNYKFQNRLWSGCFTRYRDGQTGSFFPEQTTDSLCEAVERFMQMQDAFSENILITHAQQFGVERFKAEFSRFAGLDKSNP